MPEIPMKRVVNRQANRRFNEEWYECAGCGFNFPRSQVIVQEGRVRCLVNCKEAPGHDALSRGYPLRTEDSPPELPEDLEEV